MTSFLVSKDDFPPIDHKATDVLHQDDAAARWYWGADAGYYMVDNIGRYSGNDGKRMHDIPVGWLLFVREQVWHNKAKIDFDNAFDEYYPGLMAFAEREPGRIRVPLGKKHIGQSISQCRDIDWIRWISTRPTLQQNPKYEVFLTAAKAWLANPRKYEVIRDIGERTSYHYDPTPLSEAYYNVDLAEFQEDDEEDTSEVGRITEYTKQGYEKDSFVASDSDSIEADSEPSSESSAEATSSSDGSQEPEEPTRRSLRLMGLPPKPYSTAETQEGATSKGQKSSQIATTSATVEATPNAETSGTGSSDKETLAEVKNRLRGRQRGPRTPQAEPRGPMGSQSPMSSPTRPARRRAAARRIQSEEEEEPRQAADEEEEEEPVLQILRAGKSRRRIISDQDE